MNMLVMRQSDLQGRFNLQRLAEMTSPSQEGNRMDCTPEFLGSMASAIFVGSYGAVRLTTPLMWCEKWQIVAIGAQIQDFPFALTYSCYNGGETHCGVCPTCIGRRMAFLRAGVPDPTPYLSTPADMPSPEQVRPDLYPNT